MPRVFCFVLFFFACSLAAQVLRVVFVGANLGTGVEIPVCGGEHIEVLPQGKVQDLREHFQGACERDERFFSFFFFVCMCLFRFVSCVLWMSRLFAFLLCFFSGRKIWSQSGNDSGRDRSCGGRRADLLRASSQFTVNRVFLSGRSTVPAPDTTKNLQRLGAHYISYVHYAKTS